MEHIAVLMECSLFTEPTSNSRRYDCDVAQFDRAQNSKVAIIRFLCALGKTLIIIIPISSGATQWIKAQVGNRKVVYSRFGFFNWAM